MSDEPKEDRLLDHEYDGIQEYDNPMPRWWIGIFWVTIVFAVLYWLNVPGVGSGEGRIASYERDMAQALETYGSRAPVPGSGPNEAQLIAFAKDPAKRAQGKTVYETNCTPCHRADGGAQADGSRAGRPNVPKRAGHRYLQARGVRCSV